MTTTEQTTTTSTAIPTTSGAVPGTAFRLAAVDLYKDIHKGIRAELCDLLLTAGRIDPSDDASRADLAAHVRQVAGVLEAHAHHEDEHVDPALELHLPDLAEQITADHAVLEARFAGVLELAEEAVTATGTDRRRLGHLLHLDLGAFASRYLAHQDLEERIVMPALERAVGPEACTAIHLAIVGSIPPDQMAQSLAFMLPAMNVDDRTELLGGVMAGAPAEVFAGVWGLARSVLEPGDLAAVGRRLGVA